MKLRDVRLNPEHPPLVKLWVVQLSLAMHLPPRPPLSDKFDERNFNESVVFLENDPDRVRTRAERDKPCDQHIAGGRYEIL